MKSILQKALAEHELNTLVRDHPAFADFTVLNVLKTGPDHLTAIARWRGAKVVVKVFPGPDAAKQVLKAQRELDIVARAMAAAPYRINDALAVFPDLGLIVLSFVPGVRLDKAIKDAGPAERARILETSGGWLKTYHATRPIDVSDFSPNWWIKKRKAAQRAAQPQAVEALFDAVIADLTRQAPALRGMPISKAATHGDFSSLNAHYHKGTVYGVDVQGESRLPIAKDVAKFLVWTQLHTPLEASPPVDHVAGIAATDVAAFLSCGVLPPYEAKTFLPFFVGLQLLEYLGTQKGDVEAFARISQMVGRYLDHAP